MKKRSSPFFIRCIGLVISLAIATALTPCHAEAASSPTSAKGMVDSSGRLDLDGHPLASDPNVTETRIHVVKVTTPNLHLWKSAIRPSKGTILILPGGGYGVLAVDTEGWNVAKMLNESGYDAAILEYSIATPEARRNALADAIKATELIRSQGSALGLNTASLGIIGFSAGGHLASRLVHAQGADSPFSLIMLIYPAWLGPEATKEAAPPLQGLNTEVTPPQGLKARVFVIIGDRDKPEWVAGAKAYAEACKAQGERAEFHLLPATAHGFGFSPELQGASATWPDLLKSFLEGK